MKYALVIVLVAEMHERGFFSEGFGECMYDCLGILVRVYFGSVGACLQRSQFHAACLNLSSRRPDLLNFLNPKPKTLNPKPEARSPKP